MKMVVAMHLLILPEFKFLAAHYYANAVHIVCKKCIWIIWIEEAGSCNYFAIGSSTTTIYMSSINNLIFSHQMHSFN